MIFFLYLKFILLIASDLYNKLNIIILITEENLTLRYL